MPPLRHPHPDRRGQGENQTLHEDRHRVLPQTATLTAPSPQTILDVLPACASPGRASWHLPVPKTALRSSQQFHPQILRMNQKISLHRELADLRVQLPEFLLVHGALARVTAEYGGDAVEHLLLPAGHLVRMDLILFGNLGHGLLALQGLEGYPGLERRGMVSSRSSHRICSFHRGNVQQSVHLSPCPKRPSHL